MSCNQVISKQMNEVITSQQSKRSGLRPLFPLVCALLLGWLLLTAPRHQSVSASGAKINGPQTPAEEAAALTPIQLGQAQVRAECPSGCNIPITITDIQNIDSNEGRKVKVSWNLGQISSDLKVSGVSVFAQVRLDNDKVLDGTAFVSVSTTTATIPVRGGFLDLNKGKRRAAKNIKVTVSVISNFKEELDRVRNITTRIVDNGVIVSWEFTNRPCDTAQEFEVEVKENPLHGKERASLSARSVLVKILGSNFHPDDRGIEATVTPIGRTSIICSASKSFNIP
jgi:hypothetical protein